MTQIDSDRLSEEVYLPNMRRMMEEALSKSNNAEALINGFVNSFALVLTDLLNGPKNAAVLLEGLAAHLANDSDIQN